MSRRLRSRLRAGTGLAVTSLNLEFATAAGGLDPRITFSRGSQAMVTDATGKLTYAPNNLLTNSESFEAASWAKFNSASVVANTVAAPNGTTTADTLSLTSTANSRIEQTVTVVSGASYIFSVWMRVASGTLSVRLYGIDTGGGSAFTVTTNWQRFSITQTASSATRYPAIVTDGTAGNVYIWGAQLEAVTYQTTPSPYVSTTPKNLLGYTQEFDNAAWVKSNATAYPFDPATATQGPELVTNGDFSGGATTGWSTSGSATLSVVSGRMRVENGAAITGGTSQTINTVAGKTYFWTYYVDPATSGGAVVRVRDGSTLTVISTATRTVAGTYTVYFVATGATTQINCINSNAVVGAYQDLDDISVKEVIGGLITAPDGSLTADKLVENTAAASHRVYQGLTSLASPYTLSVYAKAGERNWVRLSLFDGTGKAAFFNLSTGAIGTQSGGATGSIVSMGNGWYRCSITATLVAYGLSDASVASADADGNTSYTGDGTSGIYIWGAQLSNSASVDPYVYNPVAAPSSTAYYGPRFDYDPVTLAPKGLLIEEQRTNLLTYSEQFNNNAWPKFGASVSANVITSPDGTTNADKLIESATNAEHGTYQSITTSGTTAFSIHLKKGERSFAQIRKDRHFIVFDLQNGLITQESGGTGAIQNVGDGWYRCTIISTQAGDVVIKTSNVGTGLTTSYAYQGDGTSGIYIWGGQCEAGAFPTSYIPTVASQVTRTADVALMQGANFSNWYNQSEGTVVSAFSSFTPTGVSQAAWTISDGTNNERWFVFCPSTAIQHFMVDGGVTQVSIDVGTYATNSVFKSAMAIRLNSVQAAVNGVLGTEDTNATIPTVDRLGFGTAPSAATGFLNGHIRSISYYNTRLPNAQLQALTS